MACCKYCNGTGTYKKPNDEARFDRLVDIEMDKGKFMSFDMAIKDAYKKVGYTLIDCPFCSGEEKIIL